MGRRVVVRRVVGTRDGRPVFSDLLGELVTVDDTNLTVRDDTGVERTVPLGEVAAGKPVPPRPASHREIIALERVAAAGWPAPDTGRLGDWLLRAADGWTNRANSVLPLGEPGLPLPDALERVHAWYAERGLAPRFAVPLPARRRLDQALTDRGWPPTHAVLVQTARLAAVRTVLAGRPDLPPVRITGRPGDDWLAVASDRKGGLPDVAVRVLTGPPTVGFASVYDGDTLVAVGRGVVTDGWLGLSLVEVAATARRRGLARHVVAGLVDWAVRHHAERGYLQVEEDNRAALSLYAGLGFATHHRYVNRTAP